MGTSAVAVAASRARCVRPGTSTATGSDVDRPSPDRAALEIAHRRLDAKASIEDMLDHPALRIILENRARYLMQRRARLDVKKLQANDVERSMGEVIEESVMVIQPCAEASLQELPARRLIVDEVHRSSAANPFDQVVADHPGLVR
jgi:hypothetical protein